MRDNILFEYYVVTFIGFESNISIITYHSSAVNLSNGPLQKLFVTFVTFVASSISRIVLSPYMGYQLYQVSYTAA